MREMKASWTDESLVFVRFYKDNGHGWGRQGVGDAEGGNRPKAKDASQPEIEGDLRKMIPRATRLAKKTFFLTIAVSWPRGSRHRIASFFDPFYNWTSRNKKLSVPDEKFLRCDILLCSQRRS